VRERKENTGGKEGKGRKKEGKKEEIGKEEEGKEGIFFKANIFSTSLVWHNDGNPLKSTNVFDVFHTLKSKQTIQKGPNTYEKSQYARVPGSESVCLRE